MDFQGLIMVCVCALAGLALLLLLLYVVFRPGKNERAEIKQYRADTVDKIERKK
jgi:hypothetical protein